MVVGEPGEAAFDWPSSRDQGEASLAGWFADDVQGGGQDSGGPVHEAAGEAAVGENEPHGCGQVEAEQGRLRAVTVLDVGGADHDHQEQAQCVGDDEPFPAVDLFAGVVAAAVPGDGVGGFDALGVDDPR
ncbi:hypothetical protein GCM10027290_17320 [Micromonospora sonneratiae]